MLAWIGPCKYEGFSPLVKTGFTLCYDIKWALQDFLTWIGRQKQEDLSAVIIKQTDTDKTYRVLLYQAMCNRFDKETIQQKVD